MRWPLGTVVLADQAGPARRDLAVPRRNHVANDASPHEARAAQCSYYEQRAAHASPPPVQAAFAVQARVCRSGPPRRRLLRVADDRMALP